jgi:BirA family transcriptional regulator, biotin operon repressor / biotin---[acetyl-CoA-carboxylase] ligase
MMKISGLILDSLLLIMEIEHIHFKTIDSTNTWAKHNAHLFPHDKITLVTADEQTAGRGRFKRKWESPPNQNIYATFCFFVEKHRRDIGNIPQLLALSTYDALTKLGFDPQLKWPNDVLLNGKKVAGILCETTPYSDQLCIVLGIGINVNMPEEALCLIDRPAISLLAIKGMPFSIEEVLTLLKDKFSIDLGLFFEESFAPFLNRYKKLMSSWENKQIRFHDNRVIWKGTFHSINNDGSLNMQLDTGEVKTFLTGEILFS